MPTPPDPQLPAAERGGPLNQPILPNEPEGVLYPTPRSAASSGRGQSGAFYQTNPASSGRGQSANILRNEPKVAPSSTSPDPLEFIPLFDYSDTAEPKLVSSPYDREGSRGTRSTPCEVIVTRIAIVADLHLPEVNDSAQHAVLDWVVEVLRREQPDLVLGAGDYTASGALSSARHVAQSLREAGLPLLLTPGNSDLRSPRVSQRIRAIFTTPAIVETRNMLAVAVDSSEGMITSKDRGQVEKALDSAQDRPVVLLTHYYVEALQDESRAWLMRLLQSGRISLFVAGHGHRERSYRLGRTDCHLVRGLDPDKAIGGPPAMAFFERDGHGEWHRREISWPCGNADHWSDAERREFLDHVGLSCLGDPVRGIEQAARAGAPCIELRDNAVDASVGALESALDTWRRVGGRYLSWHMPDLVWDTAVAHVTNQEGWQRSLELAVAFGAAGSA